MLEYIPEKLTLKECNYNEFRMINLCLCIIKYWDKTTRLSIIKDEKKESIYLKNKYS